MTVSQTITAAGYLPSGERYIRGTVTFDTLYASGGEALSLTTYFSASTYPTVLCGVDDGYVASHDRGTASAGKILLWRGGIANAVLQACATNANTYAVIVPFLAIGTPA